MKTKPQYQPKSAAVQSSRARIPKNQSFHTFARAEPNATDEPSETNIRERAYTLYEEANCCDGHDIDHWVEATAQLKAKDQVALPTSW